jgi:S-adenosylmethionine:tRNA ribosyltransferase-isomerase
VSRSTLAFERPPEAIATRPPEDRGVGRDGVRLLVTTASGHEHARFRDLPSFLPRGTLLVVNRSATLPASLPATVAGATGAPEATSGLTAGRTDGSHLPGAFRLNLSTHYGGGVWLAEPRFSHAEPGPLPLFPGDGLRVAGLPARVLAPHPDIPRLVFVRIEGDLARAMAAAGEPIRYGYLEPPFPPLAAYQTLFARFPGSAEMPSAARPFTTRLVASLRARGVRIAWVVLHTGVSSLEVETDRLEDHPLYAEPFSVPRAAAAALNAARREGRPVIAVGTTVVRALESAWDGRAVRPIRGFTRRFVRPGHAARVVTGLLTGLHDPRASHLAMLHALVDPALVRDAYGEAVREGYLWHEFGDSHLIMEPRVT